MPASRAVALGFVWLLVAGCATGPRPPMLGDVLGSWRISGVEVPAGAKLPTVIFAGDGRINGSGGVNRWQATIDVGGLASGQWRPGPIAATRMAGAAEAMQLEAAFLGALGAATEVMLVDGRLHLMRDGALLVALERLTLN